MTTTEPTGAEGARAAVATMTLLLEAQEAGGQWTHALLDARRSVDQLGADYAMGLAWLAVQALRAYAESQHRDASEVLQELAAGFAVDE